VYCVNNVTCTLVRAACQVYLALVQGQPTTHCILIPTVKDNYMSIWMYIFVHFFIFQRVHLDIQVGEHAIDYANVAQKEKLSELQLRVRQLLDQVEQITKEQNYQRVSFDI
jgi:hypothetical protein